MDEEETGGLWDRYGRLWRAEISGDKEIIKEEEYKIRMDEYRRLIDSKIGR